MAWAIPTAIHSKPIYLYLVHDIDELGLGNRSFVREDSYKIRNKLQRDCSIRSFFTLFYSSSEIDSYLP